MEETFVLIELSKNEFSLYKLLPETAASITDYMIIASASSTRQTRALANNVHDKMKDLNVEIVGIEGEGEGDWVLVDIGDIIVHIMTPTTRAYFNLEELWTKT